MIWNKRFSFLMATGLAWGVFVLADARSCDVCSCTEGCDTSGHAHGHSHVSMTGGSGMKFTPLNMGPARGSSGATQTSVRFGVLADTQGLGYVNQLTTDMNNQNLDLSIYPGDLVSTGGNNSWNNWISDTSHANFDLYMVPGNHDLPVGGDALWQSKFNWLPDSQTVGGANGPQTGIDKMDYYFDVGNTRFISVTTDSQANGTTHPAADLPWFENVLNLASTQSKDHVFVMTHHPVSYSLYENSGGTAGPFWQAMVNSGAPVHGLFTGHWHHYNPGKPDPYNQQLWEVISGTGNSGFDGETFRHRVGYTVYEVDGTEVTAEFYGDLDGDGSYDDLADTFVMATATPATPGLVAHYNFDNTSSNDDYAHMMSPLGRQNNGLYYNGATSTGGELVLDGSDDYADGFGISNYNMAILRDLTLSVDANFDTLDAAPDGNTLISYSDDSNYPSTGLDEVLNQPYNLRIRSDKKIVFYWERDNVIREEFVSTVPAPVNAGEWHEYRVTRDATTGEVKFYVDGVQLGATITFDELTELPTGGQGGRIRMGANLEGAYPASQTNFFDGKIDNVSLWNMLTLDQIAFLLGDLNMDGALDQDDWLLYISGLGVDLSGLTDEERLEMGDINFDGVNDFTDFSLFKNSYNQNNGPGAFEEMLASIPEPGTLALLCLGGLMLNSVRRRRTSWSE